MPLKMIVDTLDGIPEGQQALYMKGDDGKFRLDLEGYEDPVALKGALVKERETRKALEAKARKLEEFGDFDPAVVKDLMTRIDADERLKLIKEGKWEDALNKHTERMRADYDKKLKSKDDEVAAEKAKASKWELKALDSALREAAAKVGLHPQAVDDALLRGRQVFTIDDEGNAVQFSKDGEPVYGKDGKSPLGPEEWLESMREVKPHWFPATGTGSGAGSGTPRNGAARGKTMKRAAFDKLDPISKATTVKEGVAIVD